jgi:cyclopropane fatty-acyl-phospholipid synthase-like methyltransferase
VDQMFDQLKEINSRPEPFQFYTAEELWTNEHTAKQMLTYHLNEEIDISSRNKEFIEKSVDWMTKRFNVSHGTTIADFGCGPGLYSYRLAEKGARVTGIDFSKNSIGYAKKAAQKKGLEIKYITQNYLDFETKDRFDLIIMIFCDFCALSPEQRKKMLKKFQTLLKPDGSLLLDVHSLNLFNEKEETAVYELNQLNGFWSPDDYYGFVNSFKYEKEKVSLDKYTIIETSRSRIIYNWLQYFNKDSLIKEFEENGLKIVEFYSDVAGAEFTNDSPDIAVEAKK